MSEQTKCSDNIGAHIWLGRCPACANPSAPETPAPETTEPCDLVLDAEDRELLADPPRLAALTRPETGPMPPVSPDPWKDIQAFLWHAGTCDANHDNQPCSCGMAETLAGLLAARAADALRHQQEIAEAKQRTIAQAQTIDANRAILAAQDETIQRLRAKFSTAEATIASLRAQLKQEGGSEPT